MAKRNRRFGSKKNELVKKASEAILSAVQIYNNPQVYFKSETFIVLAIIAWTYLMHAYYHKLKLKYFYPKDRSNKGKSKTRYWELGHCLNQEECPLDNATKANLQFLLGIRHEIEHQMTGRIDDFLSAKFQACAINFDYYLVKLFGEKFTLGNKLALCIQFSPITPEQEEALRNNDRLSANVKNFVATFEKDLPEEEYSNPRYAYRLLYIPVSANHKGQADQVVEFVKPDSPLAADVRLLWKDREKKKYLPSHIVKKMQERGFVGFRIQDHTDFVRTITNAKDPKSGWGTFVAGDKWYWYENWLEKVAKYCEESGEKFRHEVRKK